MMKLGLILLGLMALTYAYPYGEEQYDETLDVYQPQAVYSPENDVFIVYRSKRSPRPEEEKEDEEKKPKKPVTSITPHIITDDTQTTNTGLKWERKTKDYDINAMWNKNVRGPGRAKPVWGISGTYRW